MQMIDEAREHCRFVGNETENPAAANVKGPLENGKIDTGKIGMIFYESFSNSY